MSTELENILSGQGAVAPAPETRTEPQPEQTAEPQASAEPASEGDLPADENATVSVKAVIAEREKGKRKYTEAVTDFEQKLSEADQRWQQRFDQLVGNLTKPQPSQAEPEQAPDIWTDPDAYLQRGVQQAVSPVMGQLKAMQRGMAELQFKPEVVAEAEKAFNTAANAEQLSKEFIQQINGSANPWAAAVQWHQQQTAMAEIGSDPAAWKAQQREALKAEIMAELQQGQQSGAQRAAPVMPGNFATGRNVGARSGPAYAGPPALDDILGKRP